MLPIIIKIETCFYYACILEDKKKINLSKNRIYRRRLMNIKQLLFLDKAINSLPNFYLINSSFTIKEFVYFIFNKTPIKRLWLDYVCLIEIKSAEPLRLFSSSDLKVYVEEYLYKNQKIDLLEQEIDLLEQEFIIVEQEIDFENFLEDTENFLIDIKMSEEQRKQLLIKCWIKKERNALLFLDEQRIQMNSMVSHEGGGSMFMFNLHKGKVWFWLNTDKDVLNSKFFLENNDNLFYSVEGENILSYDENWNPIYKRLYKDMKALGAPSFEFMS